jgi:hypothetical protein
VIEVWKRPFWKYFHSQRRQILLSNEDLRRYVGWKKSWYNVIGSRRFAFSVSKHRIRVHRAIYLNTDSYIVFTKGSTLEDDPQNVTGPKQSAQIRYLTMLTGKPLKREYKHQL